VIVESISFIFGVKTYLFSMIEYGHILSIGGFFDVFRTPI
jgi:hypothetical protein